MIYTLAHYAILVGYAAIVLLNVLGIHESESLGEILARAIVIVICFLGLLGMG